ncbi:MAG: M1 family aminopeptidase [Terriglobia bacterium]
MKVLVMRVTSGNGTRVEAVKSFLRVAALTMLWAASACAQEPAAPVAQPLLKELEQVGLDAPHSYKVVDLYLRRDAIRVHLRHGTLVFLQPVAGRVTGAVFEGTGEVLVLPPDRVEAHQLVKFTGSPVLTESFASAYFRFTDNTAGELRSQLRAGGGQRVHAPALLKRWQPLLGPLNQAHALRILLDLLDSAPVPYFYGAISGQRLGSFDIVVDERRPEQVLVGQIRWKAGRRYYDVWCSFARRNPSGRRPRARAPAYRIAATITPEHELQAVCTVRLELTDPGQRVLPFQLSRLLRVEEVTEVVRSVNGETRRPLEFFHNVTLTAEEARYRGSDLVLVVLPPAPAAPVTQRRLRVRYRGRFISEVGGGVLYVGARATWYPTLESGVLADYELRFRYPRGLELVATGTRRSTREEGETKESLWVTEVPLPVAGFNLGLYESQTVERNGLRVTVYANRQLEPALARAARRRRAAPSTSPLRRDPWGRDRTLVAPPVHMPPLAPSRRLERVGNDVANALAYFTELFGPIPYSELKVSQVPGRFGQGFPGLIYLSTFSFLPPVDQARMGLSERAREHFSELTPLHEAAHQWWGNWVRLPDYRDQWLAEGLAAYSALLALEQQPGGPGLVQKWLERYRRDLLQEDDGGNPIEATGALTLGPRLDSSRSPGGSASLIYSKGPWVLHMLRELLRDPETASDALFLSGLRQLARGGEQPLTTADFQRQFESALPAYADLEDSGRLDWFFEQWVYGTGIPRYQLDWQVRPSTYAQGDPSGVEGLPRVPMQSGSRGRGNRKKGWRVEGTIKQSGVSNLFIMRLPVYAKVGTQLTRLGTVVVTDKETEFRFPVASKPDNLLLDPHLTVLSLVE